MHAAPSAQWRPSGEHTGEEALRALGKHFKLQSNVVDHLIKAQIEDLEELRFFWDTEEKIEPWVQKMGTDETARNTQLARLRRAWSAVRLWYQQAEQDRSKVATADLDTLLQDSELRDFKTLFWVRYRLKFPLRFIRQTQHFPGSAERCPRGCCASSQFGKCGHCSTSCIPPIRRGNLQMDFSRKRPKTKTQWLKIGKDIWISSIPS